MNMKILLPTPEYNFFAREHGLCFAGHHRGAQPEGWRFGTPIASTGSKPRPSRGSDRGSEGLLLGTPPSVRSPKVREDRAARTLKPTGVNIEDSRLRLSSGLKTKTREDRSTGASRRGVNNGPRSLRLSSGRKPKTREDQTMRASSRSKRQAA